MVEVSFVRFEMLHFLEVTTASFIRLNAVLSLAGNSFYESTPLLYSLTMICKKGIF